MTARASPARRTGLALLLRATLAVPAVAGLSLAPSVAAPNPVPKRGPETVDQALCRLIGDAAERQHLPAAFLTRLLWQESSFRADAVSSAGAQGVAQFMPGTAAERGLQDPFDPEQAIPASAMFLADLSHRFGNLGLAAAAYNGGPARVSSWLRGTGSLPEETRNYVFRVTGRSVEDWAAAAKAGAADAADASIEATPGTCLEVVANRRSGPAPNIIAEAALAPWGVQLAGNFSKSLALSSFERARRQYGSILGDIRPMVIGTRLLTRGYRAFYRVRVPEPTREVATALCNRIHAARGSCIVLRS